MNIRNSNKFFTVLTFLRFKYAAVPKTRSVTCTFLTSD